MANRFFVLVLGLFLFFGAATVLAQKDSDPNTSPDECIKQILESLGEIVSNSIGIAELELRMLKEEFKKGLDSADSATRRWIIKGLRDIMNELRALEKSLKRGLDKKRGSSENESYKYNEQLKSLTKDLERVKQRIKGFGRDIKKELEDLKGPVAEKIQDMLEELKKIMERLEQEIKGLKQRQEPVAI